MPAKALKHLAKVTWKHTKAGIPDPCIRVRRGAGKEFVRNFFDPTTAFQVEVGTIVNGKKKKIKKQPYQKVCLW